MRVLILVLTIFVPTVLFSQDAGKSFINKISIGINISPDVTGRTIFNNSGDGNLDDIVDAFSDLEKPMMAYSGGVTLNYATSTHFSVVAGLMFSNKGFSTKKADDLFFGDMIDPRYGYVYNTQDNSYVGSIKSIRFVSNFYYLDIPLRIYYTTGQKRLRFVGGLGVTANYLLKAKQSAIYVYTNGERERITSDQPHDFRKFNVSPSVSAGVDYRMNSEISVKFEPTFTYGLIKITDSPISGRLWSAGLNFSVYFQIK